jgi:hypothetical protein
LKIYRKPLCFTSKYMVFRMCSCCYSHRPILVLDE